MGLGLNALCSLAVCVLAVWEITAADSAHPADCDSLVLNMVDCLSFVSNGSTTAKPEGTCCSGLKTVLRTDPKCLCEGFKNSADFGVSLNVTKAATLPAACDVPAPPVSNCDLNGAGNPSTSPAAPLSPRRAPPSMGSPAGTSPVPIANSPTQENSVSSIRAPAFAAAMAAAFLVLLF